MMYRGGKLRLFSLSSRLNSSYSYSCVDLKASSSSTSTVERRSSSSSLGRSRYCLGGSGRINLYPPWVKSVIASLDSGGVDLEVKEYNNNLYPLVKSATASLAGGEVARRLKFSECVESYGFSHSLESFAMLAGIFSSANMYGEVRCLFRSMADFCKSNSHWELLLVLLDEILHLSNGSITPSQAYGCLILVLAECCSMGAHAELVLYVAEKMGIEVRVPLPYILLKRLVVGSSEGLDLFLMVSPNNVYTFTIMMDVYNTAEDNSKKILMTAEDNWKKILMEEEESPAPDDHDIGLVYGTILLGLCLGGRLESAWKFVCELQERGQPCKYNNCYNALMLGFCDRGDMDSSLMVLKMMKDWGLSPDVNSYTILIHGFCNKGDVEKAYELLYEMDVGCGINMPSTPAIYASLVRSSFVAGDAETTEKAFRKMKSSTTEGGHLHDPFFYVLLLHLYFRCGDMDAFRRLAKEIMDGGSDSKGIMHMMGFISEQVADLSHHPRKDWALEEPIEILSCLFGE